MDVKVDVQWKHNRIIGLLPEPRWKAHASGSRLSRRLLDIISVFASRHFQLQYVESMFATLAMQNNLNCEYDRIMKLGCCYNDPSYERLLAGARPGDTVQWWHPFKNISQHAEFRKQLFEDGYI